MSESIALHDRLRWYAHWRCPNQSELARRMGRDQRWVNNLLLGKREMKARDLPLFAAALGVSVQELVAVLFPTGEATAAAALVTDWLQRLQRLSPADRAALETVCDALARHRVLNGS